MLVIKIVHTPHLNQHIVCCCCIKQTANTLLFFMSLLRCYGFRSVVELIEIGAELTLLSLPRWRGWLLTKTTSDFPLFAGEIRKDCLFVHKKVRIFMSSSKKSRDLESRSPMWWRDRSNGRLKRKCRGNFVCGRLVLNDYGAQSCFHEKWRSICSLSSNITSLKLVHVRLHEKCESSLSGKATAIGSKQLWIVREHERMIFH